MARPLSGLRPRDGAGGPALSGCRQRPVEWHQAKSSPRNCDLFRFPGLPPLSSVTIITPFTADASPSGDGPCHAIRTLPPPTPPYCWCSFRTATCSPRTARACSAWTPPIAWKGGRAGRPGATADRPDPRHRRRLPGRQPGFLHASAGWRAAGRRCAGSPVTTTNASRCSGRPRAATCWSRSSTSATGAWCCSTRAFPARCRAISRTTSSTCCGAPSTAPANASLLVSFHHHPVPIGSDWMDPIGLRNPQALFDLLAPYPQVRCLLWGTFTRSSTASAARCACWLRRPPACSSPRQQRLHPRPPGAGLPLVAPARRRAPGDGDLAGRRRRLRSGLRHRRIPTCPRSRDAAAACVVADRRAGWKMKPGSWYRSAFPTELKPISPFPMTATSPSLLYIHGFNSSPESHKARQLQAAFGHGPGRRPARPGPAPSPTAGHRPVGAGHCRARATGAGRQPWWLLCDPFGGAPWPGGDPGQSGGRPASLLRRLPGRADQPLQRRDLGTHRGPRAALAELEVTRLQRPERYQVWLQTADETLDYRAAQAFYRACALRIQAGGDHGFQGFARHLPALLAFAGYPSALWRDTDFSTLTE